MSNNKQPSKDYHRDQFTGSKSNFTTIEFQSLSNTRKQRNYASKIIRVSEHAAKEDLLEMYLRLTERRPPVQYRMPIWIPEPIAKKRAKKDTSFTNTTVKPAADKHQSAVVEDLCYSQLSQALKQPEIAEEWNRLPLKSQLFVKMTLRNRLLRSFENTNNSEVTERVME